MKTSLFTAISALLIAPIAQAELITYDLQWSGLNFQNEASATGQVTIDTNLVPNPGFYGDIWEASPFSNFSITVIGAISGNGTFSTLNNDYTHVNWDVYDAKTDPMIDFHSELIGQFGFNDFNVFSGDFNEEDEGGNPNAPTGAEQLLLQTSRGHGDFIQLVSMRPVPTPSTLALLGLGALATTRRRR